MKTQDTKKSISKTFTLLGFFLIAFLTFNTSQAQTNNKVISGKIHDSFGPLPGVNIVLKGTKTGTATNNNGEFSFPNALKVGDVLIISYLGYKKQFIEITENTQNINITLAEAETQIIGALNANVPYTSKR